MRLNPEISLFIPRVGKFLGFYLAKRGMKANPDKYEAIIQMKAPTSKKDIQRLNGMMTVLNRLISIFVQQALPLYRVLRKQAGFEWNVEFNNAFESFKIILATLPVLTKPSSGEVLYL